MSTVSSSVAQLVIVSGSSSSTGNGSASMGYLAEGRGGGGDKDGGHSVLVMDCIQEQTGCEHGNPVVCKTDCQFIRSPASDGPRRQQQQRWGHHSQHGVTRCVPQCIWET